MNQFKNVLIVIAIFMGVFLLVAKSSLANFSIDDVAGMWLFDDGDGTVAADSSQNGNNGVIHGAAWVDGKFGKALEFDGETNWVEVPHSDTLGFEAGVSFTITLHYKGTKVGGSLAGKGYEDTTQALPWYMFWNGGGDNKITLFLRDAAGASFRLTNTTDVADDEWHFVAGRADADTGKGSLWVDGNLEGEFDFNADSGYGNSESVFHIARHFDRYTAGIIDEVALFNVALDESDLQSIMNDGLATLTAVEAADKLTTTWGNVKQRVTR